MIDAITIRPVMLIDVMVAILKIDSVFCLNAIENKITLATIYTPMRIRRINTKVLGLYSASLSSLRRVIVSDIGVSQVES